jgi:hypothetical protein
MSYNKALPKGKSSIQHKDKIQATKFLISMLPEEALAAYIVELQDTVELLRASLSKETPSGSQNKTFVSFRK